MNYMHRTLAEGRWAQMSLAEQMLNIGSEIHRANRWKAKDKQEYCNNAVYRALELLSLTIDAQRGKHSLKEFTRLYEIIGDYYFGENRFNTDGASLEKYFDVFAPCKLI